MPNIIARIKAARQAWRFPGGPGNQNEYGYYGGGSAGDLWAGLRALILGQDPMPWDRMVGRLHANSAVTPFVNYARRKFPEAAPVVLKEGVGPDRASIGAIVPGHPLTTLLRRPNPYYGYSTLIAGVLLSRFASGNSFIFKVRDGYGRVVQLWYVPHFFLSPGWDKDSKEYLTHWNYTLPGVNGGPPQVTRMATEDVIHIRHGVDPDNERLGLSDLAYLFREINLLNEATVYAGSILHNFGVPGIMVIPEGETTIAPGAADVLKEIIRDRTTGTNRGSPIVAPMGVKIETLGYSPEQLALDKFLNVPEARISAAVGIPSAALGLNVGENQKSYANAKEAREQAVEDWLLPTARDIADDMDAALRLDFKLADTERFAFNTSVLRELQVDVNARRLTLIPAVGRPYLTVNEARTVEGLDPLPDGDTLYDATAAAAAAAAALNPAPAQASNDGNSDTRPAKNGSARSGVGV